MTPLRTFALAVAALAAGALSTAGFFLLYGRDPAASGPRVADFALLDAEGYYHRLSRHRDAKAIVFYVHGLGCTVVENSLASLQALRDRYREAGVRFFLLNANPRDDRAALTAEAARLGIPILKDESQLVIEGLAVARTGESILIDPSTWTIRYRGPIDDRVGYEGEKPRPRQAYLRDAIEAQLDGDSVALSAAPAPGCLIEPLAVARPVSYQTDVVPVLRNKCLACHRSGGGAPWAMDRYETVKAWNAMMREVIMNHRMPPWHADPAIGAFSPDLSLTVAEKRTLVHWIDAGAPRSAAADPLVSDPPEADRAWPLGEPDLVIDLPAQKLPAQGVLPYRWLKVPIQVDKDQWVRAAHLKPSNPRLMHHGFVFVHYPERLKAREPAWLEGLNGFFTAQVPGFRITPFPEGSGQFLPAGSTLVFQLHYVTVGQPSVDRPRLALYFHDRPPPREYAVASAANRHIRIPPGAPDHRERAELELGEEVTLDAFYPHMHYRGSHFRYEARYPDGRVEPLLSVPNYSFTWQTVYRLASPLVLPKGTRIAVEAGFDNSDRNPVNPDPSKEVRWGLKDYDEMLVGYLMYTRARPTGPAQPHP
jgi:hypothetical protein